jgi:tetratricopeptide (TPR) repeat protein
MKKIFLFLSFLILNACKPAVQEYVLSRSRMVIDIDDAKFVVEENSVADSQKIRIEKKSAPKIVNTEGYRIVGPAYVINPPTLTFEKPVQFACPAKKQNLALAVKIANGFVPLAESKVAGETLQAKIRHGGEYFLVEIPEKYGILNPVKTNQGLLIVSDLYVGKYLDDFKKVLKKEGYNYPVWTYVYSGERSIEENAKLLAEEMKKLHAEYGKFRLDVLSFGVGGLITHRYLADSALYGYDISSAIVAVGSPFFGSNLAEYDSVKKSQSPYRFFFVDALGDNARELTPASDFIKWITENRSIVGWVHDDLEENKNFASLSGRVHNSGSLPEQNDGDNLVALSSTQLTWIEPDPFPLKHFELYDNKEVLETAVRFIKLYRTFTWPRLFTDVWEGRKNLSTIADVWIQEVQLTFRKLLDYEALLEWYGNILQSTPQNAILITNGDMDTYPGWYLQEKGERKDVIIANLSLLNLASYARYLKKNGLPLDLSDEQLDSLKPYRKNGSTKIVFVADQIIKPLCEQKKRPVVFSTTVYPAKLEDYSLPLKLTGLVYRVDTGGIAGPSKLSTFDPDLTRDLFFSKFRYDKIFSVPFDSLSPIIQSLVTNYRASLVMLQTVYKRQKKYDEALSVLQFVKKFNQSDICRGGLSIFSIEADIYYKMGKKDKADSVLEAAMQLPIGSMYYPAIDSINIAGSYKNVAIQYHSMDEKEKAIKALAEALKFSPRDKDLVSLIKQYQGE